MSSELAIIELQRKAADENYSLTDVLRFAYIVATKLNLIDFKNWISCELNGYTDSIPEYRYVETSIRYNNFVYGWQPVLIPSDKRSELCRIPFKMKIFEIIALKQIPEEFKRFRCSLEEHSLFNQIIDVNSKLLQN